MSGSFRRRHSKWDHKDSEDLTENFHKAQTRRPRELVSPSRGSQRRDSRSKETMMAWDREGNNARTSTGPGELRRHHSRSPRNGWGRLHSRSRSRTRSRSPSHYLRQEPAVNDRSRSRSGVSAQLCKEFVAGRCRRGSSCHFLHQDAQPYDSQTDDWENRPRRVGGSRYSPVDTNDYPPRAENTMHICSEFLKGRCRRGASCKYEHHDPVSDALKEDIIDDVHRDRDVNHKSRDAYPHRNHDSEPVDVFEKGPADDVHRGRGRDGDRDRDSNRDNVHRNRDPYSHRNNDREPADVFENGPIDVFHRDRDNSHRNRDTYSHRNHDREHADVFEKRPVSDVHRDRDTALKSRDTYSYRNHDHEPADMYEKTPVDDVHRDRDNHHRSRETFQNHDREPIDVFAKGPVDDAYRDRDNDHRVRDPYRNHDREPHKRGAPLCKFFASGNCKNGNRCRFVHEVRERLSPEKRSLDDKWGSDNKVESNQVWDGPSWTDVATMQNDVPLRGWGNEKNEVVEVNAAKSGDKSHSHEMLNMKETWVTPVANDGVHMQDEKPPLQWETEISVPSIGLSASRGAEYVSGDMEISPRDIKQPGLSSSNSRAPSLSNISFATDLPDSVGGAFYEKPYSVEFQEQKPYNDPFPTQSPSHKEEKPYNDPFPMQSHPSHEEEKPYNDPFPMQNHPSHQENPNVYLWEGTNVIGENHHPSHEEKPNVYHREGTNVLGNNHGSCIIPISTMNVPPQHGFFQSDQIAGAQPSSGVSTLSPHFPNPTINGPLHQGFLQTVGVQPSSDIGPLAPHFQSQTMNVTPQQGFFTSDQTNSVQHSSGLSSAAQGQAQLHSETSFVNSIATDGPCLNATPSGLVSATANHTTVSNDPLVQLLENRNLSVSLAQLLENSKQFPQLSIPPGMPPVYGSTMQTNQVPEISQQQYDPISDSVEPNVHDSSYQRLIEKRVLDDEDGNMKQQEPVTESKDDEKVKEIAEGSMKDPENRPSEDVPMDEGDDANKSKDTKAIRPFKFALAEFVKELLKPSWKDGHVSKDAYKTIVKKVVDKIIETQGLQIPQTKEKIDHYLSCSKPKIDKLVQAYVGKFQKT